ncbi:MFS transporter, partial [Lacticaseibacillus paracasei]
MSHKNLGWQAQTAAFLLSQNLFVFGSSTVFYAVLWDIALKTSSGAWMTYVSLATALPAILISLAAGVLADRYNRKMLIVLSAAVVTLLTLL